MENLSVNCFMDGDDFVVVFKDTKPETADLIRNILGITEAPEKIEGLKPEEPKESDEEKFSYRKPVMCPDCGKQMKFETAPDSREAYQCVCGKRISIFTCGRNLTDDEAKDVIENGKSTKKYRFHSGRTGKDYETYIRLSDKCIKPDFERKN